MGNQMPKNFPIMFFDANASRMATLTSRLQAMPFMNADQSPRVPVAM